MFKLATIRYPVKWYPAHPYMLKRHLQVTNWMKFLTVTLTIITISL